MNTQTEGSEQADGEAPGERAPRALRAIGWAVRKRRKELGLSQEALGAKAGVHRNYLGGVERAEQNPSFLNLIRIAKGLDLSLVELVERAEAEEATLS